MGMGDAYGDWGCVVFLFYFTAMPIHTPRYGLRPMAATATGYGYGLRAAPHLPFPRSSFLLILSLHLVINHPPPSSLGSLGGGTQREHQRERERARARARERRGAQRGRGGGEWERGGGANGGESKAESKASLLAHEKRRRRRESHNAVERRRRDNINEKISELATLIPECLLEGAQPNQSQQSPGSPDDALLSPVAGAAGGEWPLVLPEISGAPACFLLSLSRDSSVPAAPASSVLSICLESSLEPGL
ncbi:hypothetical protein B0H14DRAFT_3883451 [Mycena olivaceomarginata]|nr:hypothetical protein B0H14DRAFT_3883451 [Mycena olivaceomarginata]